MKLRIFIGATAAIVVASVANAAQTIDYGQSTISQFGNLGQTSVNDPLLQ